MTYKLTLEGKAYRFSFNAGEIFIQSGQIYVALQGGPAWEVFNRLIASCDDPAPVAIGLPPIWESRPCLVPRHSVRFLDDAGSAKGGFPVASYYTNLLQSLRVECLQIPQKSVCSDPLVVFAVNF